jgi:hypothetical protein
MRMLIRRRPGFFYGQPTASQQPGLSDRLARAVGVRSAVAPYLAANFAAFAQRAFRIIDPARLQWNWHHDLIAEHLVLAKQRRIKRLAISIPPRGLKSMLVSVLWAAWVWITSPRESFICAGHSASLSTDFSLIRRQLLESQWFQRLWPGVVEFRGDQNRQDDYANMKGGRMLATGMSNVVGYGANFLVIDDPLTPLQAHSELERATCIRAFNSGLRSRLNSPTEDVIVVVQQRLHRGDLVATLQDSPEAPDWTFVSLPMVEPEDREIVFPVSGRVVQRHKGDLLHPARWSAKWCERESEGAGPYVWAAQYLQNPSDPSQSILKPEFWRYWTYAGAMDKAEGVLVRPNEFDSIVIAGDLAFTKSNTSDRVALGVFGRHKGFTYLLQLEWGRLDFGETVEALRRLVREYPGYSRIVIEKAANAAALLSSLQSEIPGITLVPPQGSKQARYHGISAICARGEVVLPHSSIYRQSADLVSELEHAGVGGRWDDAADCLALGVSTLGAMSGSDRPTPFLLGESACSISSLRQFLAGEAPHAFPVHVSEKVAKGEPLTDRDWDDACFSSIREFM